MRRPRFYRWIRSETMRMAHTSSFNLRKMAARAQRNPQGELAAALLLYAHENNQVERLFKYVYEQDLLDEYKSIEERIGHRSIERLALRGTPLRSLPDRYGALLEAYDAAYHMPERIANEKGALRESIQLNMLRSGTTPAELARALDLDPGNLNAFLTRGETHRFTLETTRRIACAVQ